MSGAWKEKEGIEHKAKELSKDAKDGRDKWKDRAKELEKVKDKELSKEKEGHKEVYKEAYGKEGSKDGPKGESKEIETRAFAPPLAALHRRVAALEAALGIGAPFIAQEERPEVGAAALEQPLREKER